ncbi:MAG: hypothetical protein ACLGIN_01015 [Candidatus Sericytochromatia bacterium]
MSTTRRLDGAIALAFALLLVAFAIVSWQKWPMLTADSARELYVPFRILKGEQIYQDFTYLYGPVAPTLNGWLLGLFGARLEVLYMAGLATLGAIMGLLYLVARQMLRPLPAAAVVFLFFTHFALGRDIAGYVWPYAFAATYGVLLGLVALFGLLRHLRSPHPGWLVLSGLAIGLSTVTKLEYGFAAAGLGAAFLGLRVLFDGRRALGEALLLVGPAIAVAGAIAASVLLRVPLPTVLESVWPVELMKLWNSQSGWHGHAASWAWNLKWVLIHGVILALAFGHQAIGERLKAGGPWRWGLLAVGAAGLALAWRFREGLGFYLTSGHHYWMSPGFLLLFALIAWAAVAAGQAIADRRALPVLAVSWGLLALYGCLVATRTLMTGYNDYMRYQAPVALVAWVALAAIWLPALASRLGLAGARRGTAIMGAIVILLGVRHLGGHLESYTAPHVAVSSVVGTVLAPPAYAEPFNQALAYVKDRVRPGEAVVAAPMEASFYLFSGLPNVMREDNLYYGFLTTEASQHAAIARMRDRRVRFLVVSNYGAFMNQRFGETFMPEIGDWIARECKQVAVYGDEAYRLRIYETPYSSTDSGR